MVDTKNPLVNIDAERAVLGAVLIDNNVVAQIGALRPEDFSRDLYKKIYSAILDLSSEDTGIDYMTLESKLRTDKALVASGGLDEITALTDNVPTLANVGHYADIVLERSIARGLHAATARVKSDLEQGVSAPDAAQAILSACETSGQSGQASTLVDAYEALEGYQNGSQEGFILSGVKAIDNDYAPPPGDLVVVAARPSIGKTALSVFLADKYAERNLPVLFVSAEMSGVALHHRRVAAMAGVSVRSLRTKGSLSGPQWDRTARAFETLNKTPLKIIDGYYRLHELTAAIRSAVATDGVRVVFIDHLGKLGLVKSERRDLALGDATQKLAALGKKLGVTIFLLCQLNRANEASAGRERPRPPRLSDLRDSGRIEEDADGVWMLDRDSYYIDDADDEFLIYVNKQRDGATGIARLHFREATGGFVE